MTKNEFIEEVFKLAFGYDAINRGYSQEEVLERIKHISDFWFTFGNGEPIDGNEEDK